MERYILFMSHVGNCVYRHSEGVDRGVFLRSSNNFCSSVKETLRQHLRALRLHLRISNITYL